MSRKIYKPKNVEVCCPDCLQKRHIVKNATRQSSLPATEDGIILFLCKPCSTKRLTLKRLEEGFYNKLNDIQKNKTRVKPLNKGDVYGDFTVIDDEPTRTVYICESSKKRTVRALWKCQCKCGVIVQRTTSDLLAKGEIKKCTSCGYKARPQSTQKYSNIERLYNLSIVSREKSSKGRIKNKLSLEEFTLLIAQNCFYCGAEPKEVIYGKNKVVENRTMVKNGVDRKDSNKDYCFENCVPCCKICNIMKSSLSINDFYAHIKTIYLKHEKKD